MSELIPVGTGASAWYPFTVAQGAPKTLFLKGAGAESRIPTGVNFEVAHVNSGGDYTVLDVLNAGNINAKGTVTAAGNFALRRLDSTTPAGADVEG